MCLLSPSLLAEERAGSQPHFIRGDGNSDGFISLADVITIIRFLHRNTQRPPCADAADFDDSGNINVIDVVTLIGFVFFNSNPFARPAAPFPSPGPDETPDPIDCQNPPPVRGGGAQLGERRLPEVACTPEDFLGDSGPTGIEEPLPGQPGQVIDFVRFSRNCVYAYPGQEDLRIPVLITNAEELEGFTLSVYADPRRIWLERFDFTESVLESLKPELTYNYNRWLREGYLAATVVMDFEPPFHGRVFPKRLTSKLRVADLVFGISPLAEADEILEIRFATTPGLSELRPSIANEFSAAGVSRAPYLERPVTLKIEPRERLFLRGDANRDEDVNISDVILILRYLFLAAEAQCLDPLDADDDDAVNVADAIYLALFLFRGGELPARPFPHFGLDSGDDALGDC